MKLKLLIPVACLAACAAFPTGGSGLAGNSVECRLRQITDNPEACDAASVSSDGTCGSACDGYCTQVMANCQGDNAIFGSMEECVETCGLMPVGEFDD